MLLRSLGLSIAFFLASPTLAQESSKEEIKARLEALQAEIAQSKERRNQAACIKRVFHRFCLGGYREELPDEAVEIEDDSIGYLVDGDLVILKLAEDRVAVVSRQFSPGTWLTYSDLFEDLKEVYGEDLDASYFLEYAETPDEKARAIALGKSSRSRRPHPRLAQWCRFRLGVPA